MKALFINTSGGTASHGRIAFELAKKLESEGNECRIAYGRNLSSDPDFKRIGYRIGNEMNVWVHGLQTRLFDTHGFGSKIATKTFIKWADEYNPDLLWLHNIHGYYINIELLFEWIKSRPQMKTKWTLHDCWAFTGHCSHFSMVKCDKWKKQCSICPQKKEYPGSLLIDNSKDNYVRKKLVFTNVKNMTIITPSHWLANLVKQSFLQEYPIEVHYNTIDTTVFKPTPSDFRKKYGLEEKKIVLGVANVWHERKGLNDFIKLASMLDDQYVIILVGLTQKQINALPKNIIGLTKTDSQQELAAIYTVADVYANPSKEETFGMTSVEALACGTDVIVYQDTACEEIVSSKGGIAIPQSISALYQAITGQKIVPEVGVYAKLKVYHPNN